jgi:hypothetical protein
VTCPTCGGRGLVTEGDGPASWPTECHGCDGLGTSPCGACDGTGLAPQPREAPPGCAHELGVPEWTGQQGWSASWALVRCATCGLSALRRSGEDLGACWACPTCGHLRCVCP